MKNRKILAEWGYEEAVVFENPDYDDAIIGISHDERVVYSYSKMVEHLMREEGMEEIDAVEFIDYNTIRSLPYVERSPIVVYDSLWT